MSKAQTPYEKGVAAEARAAAQLRLAGYKILKTRYKTRYGEIDVIALSGDMLVFVEVKARETLDDSLYAITPRNRRRVEQAALYFLAEHPDYADYAMRFDVMAFSKNGKAGGMWAEHLDNAWQLGS
ncbi:MAG: YraN family protein [Bdellovibrionales bacterium]